MEIKDLYALYLACGCRVTTDSRAIEGGEIFFALRGENFDGNNYALQALGDGAAWAVVNADAGLSGEKLIPVEDPLTTLRDLAIHHREALGIPVVGLTGTNGKTTTKELIAAVLSRKYRITATQGNLNNDIGVPLSLLKMRPDTQLAVIEMGANHPDDIAKLVKVSRPTHGLITNVGKAHLLGFGSIEGVKAAKGELYNWLGAHGGLIFLNEDDADLREMALRQHCHQFGYGLTCQGAKVLPATADCPFLALDVPGYGEIHTSLVGAYNATNVLAALAVGRYFGVSEADAVVAIEAYTPANQRSQMQKTGRNTLIVDAYNANPSSMAVALDNLAAVQAPRKLALLGEMRELGAESAVEHQAVVRRLLDGGLEALLVGEEFIKAARECGAAFRCFATSDDLAAWLAANPVSGATILVKGSRGTRMEKVLPSL
ncbi:MAG: UDP-N-acetylmuramoyl-tripeptide--D-alanyl-D-alanine ligase [Bacteroidales bacterium]|nr:UDP-N-acetylmuramoyl-tripeptide--D-alanyl-D-alanine ligase [Bacteroidales bacterium]